MKLIIILLIISVLCFLFSKVNLIKSKYFKTFLKYVSISLFVSCFFELFVFNFRHFESLTFGKEKELSYVTGPGLSCEENECEIIDYDKAYIEVTGINQKIHNVYLDIEPNDSTLVLEMKMFFNQLNGLKEYLNGNTIKYLHAVKRGHYFKVNSTDSSERIRFQLVNNENNVALGNIIVNIGIDSIKINSIAINKKVPLFVEGIRIILLSSLIFVVLFMRKKSVFHEISFDNKATTPIVIILGSLIACISLLLTTYNCYVNRIEQPKVNQYQYQHYADALIHKRISLDLDVSKELLELDNPYDTAYRYEVLGVPGDKYYWDYSFYKGKYYSYFGIVPCVTMYVPYRLITGTHLRNFVALSTVICFLAFTIFFFYYQLCKKFFSKTSLPWYLFLSLFSFISSGAIIAMAEAGFYAIPIIFGLALAHLGIGLWLKSTMVRKHKLLLVSLGSLSVALIAGCRPQLLIALFFAIPIFLADKKKGENLLKRYSVKQYLAFFIPIVVIALMAMAYNYIRFDSILEFGANYNLTTNDMTHRGLKMDRTALGYYEFLFKPSKINVEFPFLETYEVTSSYKGITIAEPMHGGFLFINIICLCSMFPWLFKKVIKKKELNWILYLSLFLILLVVFADTQLAGILPRYMLDFGWLFSLSTIIIILSLFNKFGKSDEFHKGVLFFFMLAIILNIMSFFTGETIFMDNNNFIYRMYYIFMFWI